ncbi:hypothetical protein IQ268_28035 [Oculatella sp. LEGE 06141]|uniref:hypothetical protein n=1 Tax=Oculatella sp. LEGE 06141 TaxID=1828648 RepID=UPI00187E7874|nr:hypothetical protein [Oculatella sp. LEGE 06141]MBE9182402.1 hypothetical protein [Oculatella sp. LEGE 06141]
MLTLPPPSKAPGAYVLVSSSPPLENSRVPHLAEIAIGSTERIVFKVLDVGGQPTALLLATSLCLVAVRYAWNRTAQTK